MSLKFTKELCVMTMKNDAKLEEELTFRFKIDIGNWLILTRALTSLKNFNFDVLLLSKLYRYRGVIFHETEEWYKIWRGIDLSFENWHWEFDKFWPENSKVSKTFILMGSFWTKYILFELKRSTEELSFMTLKSDKKFGDESTYRLKIDMKILKKFDRSTRKFQKWSPFDQSIYCLS